MIIDPKYGKFSLIFNQNEKEAIINAINYIMVDLINESQTRTGYNAAEYMDLLEILDDTNQSIVLFEKTHLFMIHQALNEVINGISIPNFIAEIGIPERELEISREQLSNLLR